MIVVFRLLTTARTSIEVMLMDRDWETYTVKAVVYARSKEEAVEIAYDMGDFDVIDGSINLEERIK